MRSPLDPFEVQRRLRRLLRQRLETPLRTTVDRRSARPRCGPRLDGGHHARSWRGPRASEGAARVRLRPRRGAPRRAGRRRAHAPRRQGRRPGRVVSLGRPRRPAEARARVVPPGERPARAGAGRDPGGPLDRRRGRALAALRDPGRPVPQRRDARGRRPGRRRRTVPASGWPRPSSAWSRGIGVGGAATRDRRHERPRDQLDRRREGSRGRTAA